jgi:hypothetical protein
MRDKPEVMIQGGDAQGHFQPSQPQIPDLDDFKPKINNLIWMYGPPSLTLQEAEERACAVINLIMEAPRK